MKSSTTKGVAFGLACIALCGSALADPREDLPTSCMGYEAADVSPPGSEDGPFSRYGMPGILAFIGIKKLKTGVPPMPTDSINSMKQDLRVVKGNGK